MGMIDTWVTLDGEYIYPARLDRSNRWNGWLSPGLTLDVVRQLAAHTEEAAEAYGHECVDQIVVIDGEPEPVVLHIRWQYLPECGPSAATVVTPDEDGLYWIGGSEWTWSEVEDGPLYYSQKAAQEAWQRVLTESARRIGEILRAQVPTVTTALVSPHTRRIVEFAVPDGTGRTADHLRFTPVDGTLGEADEVLRKALDHGWDAVGLEISGWRPARDIGHPELHRIHFPAPGQEPAGDGPLEEARAAATEARRKLLVDTVPYLVADCRAVCPDAAGVLVDPAAEEPFLKFLVDGGDDTRSIAVPAVLAQKVHDRLVGMFAYRPTGADLTACGWRAATGREDGAYLLLFPAE